MNNEDVTGSPDRTIGDSDRTRDRNEPADHSGETGDSTARVVYVRRGRAPRIGSILLVFILLGVVAGVVLALFSKGSSPAAVLYFAVLGALLIGAVGGIIGVILDMLYARRLQSAEPSENQGHLADTREDGPSA
ncbi:hypothetical protein [Devriesea agamarum]|uniref:hypothetical protein n=1 Tax=Devriesea agamarum TaxID=472569 RepID=UPI00071CED69|nr:hypothetical protein [Devriesea agamarum]